MGLGAQEAHLMIKLVAIDPFQIDRINLINR